MDRLIAYFRREHLTLISEKSAGRLAQTVRNMRKLDAGIRMGITGYDVTALLPRQVDVTLGELRKVIAGRRGVA